MDGWEKWAKEKWTRMTWSDWKATWVVRTLCAVVMYIGGRLNVICSLWRLPLFQARAPSVILMAAGGSSSFAIARMYCDSDRVALSVAAEGDGREMITTTASCYCFSTLLPRQIAIANRKWLKIDSPSRAQSVYIYIYHIIWYMIW